MSLLFGNLSGGISGGDTEEVKKQAYIMLYLGCGVFLFCYLYITYLSIMADRLTVKLKVAYLRSILNQECSWFD